MRRLVLLWSLAGMISVLLTVLAFIPATWMAFMLERQTGGRFTLGDAQGSLWMGSAFIGVAPGNNEPVTPLLPGRFAWRLSPAILLGHVDAELANTAALSQPVRLTGGWHQLRVSETAILLPAERLAALGAPLNTVQPSGRMRLSWPALQLTRQGGVIGMTGSMKLEMNDIASRLSPLKPLGAYEIVLAWHGREAAVTLKTIKGPMQLNGAGVFSDGRLQFSGTAQAEAGQEEKLANLLNLLGQRRKEGGRDVIALEFK